MPAGTARLIVARYPPIYSLFPLFFSFEFMFFFLLTIIIIIYLFGGMRGDKDSAGESLLPFYREKLRERVFSGLKIPK